MGNKTRIKAIEANTPQRLAADINKYFADMDADTCELQGIDYRDAFVFYEGDPYPHPRHIAYIRYIDREA